MTDNSDSRDSIYAGGFVLLAGVFIGIILNEIFERINW